MVQKSYFGFDIILRVTRLISVRMSENLLTFIHNHIKIDTKTNRNNKIQISMDGKDRALDNLHRMFLEKPEI